MTSAYRSVDAVPVLGGEARPMKAVHLSQLRPSAAGLYADT